jgi:hypothetical protein
MRLRDPEHSVHVIKDDHSKIEFFVSRSIPKMNADKLAEAACNALKTASVLNSGSSKCYRLDYSPPDIKEKIIDELIEIFTLEKYKIQTSAPNCGSNGESARCVVKRMLKVCEMAVIDLLRLRESPLSQNERIEMGALAINYSVCQKCLAKSQEKVKQLEAEKTAFEAKWRRLDEYCHEMYQNYEHMMGVLRDMKPSNIDSAICRDSI